MLNAVDAFMLGAVVHEHALNVFHTGNGCQIAEEQCHTHKGLCHRGQCRSGSRFVQQFGQEVRHHQKENDGDDNGKCDGSVHHQPVCLFFFRFLLLLFLFRRRLFLFLLLVLIERSGVHKGTHADDHRIGKAEDAAQNRNF